MFSPSPCGPAGGLGVMNEGPSPAPQAGVTLGVGGWEQERPLGAAWSTPWGSLREAGGEDPPGPRGLLWGAAVELSPPGDRTWTPRI